MANYNPPKHPDQNQNPNNPDKGGEHRDRDRNQPGREQPGREQPGREQPGRGAERVRAPGEGGGGSGGGMDRDRSRDVDSGDRDVKTDSNIDPDGKPQPTVVRGDEAGGENKRPGRDDRSKPGAR